MNKSNKLFLFIFLISIFFSINSFAISLTDYKVPVSTTQDMQLDANWNYEGIGDSTQSNTGNASLKYKRYYESLPFGYNILLDVETNYNENAPKGENKSTGGLSAEAGAKKYLVLDNMFAFGGFRMDYEWEATDNSDSNDVYDQPDVKMEIGMGYGKYINATPLAKSLRVEEELKKLDALTGNLPDETRLELAKLLSDEKKQEYEDKYEAEIWKRYYFEAIEEILLASGMLKGETLEAITVIRIQQVMDEVFNTRFYGWEARCGLTQQILTPKDDQDKEANLRVSAGYALPLSLRSQFQITAFTETELNDFFDAYTAELKPEFSYEVSNKIDFNIYYKLNLRQEAKTSEQEKKPYMKKAHTLNASFKYEIEGKLNLIPSLRFEKDLTQEEWSKSFKLIFSYDII